MYFTSSYKVKITFWKSDGNLLLEKLEIEKIK
jgi:hypothetical protein